jgi:hypothetical protein
MLKAVECFLSYNVITMTQLVCREYGKPQTNAGEVMLGVKPMIPQIQSRTAP